MLKNLMFIFLLLALSFYITTCKKDSSPTETYLKNNNLEGLWQESFHGFTELVFVPDDDDFLYEPDSIIITSNLQLKNDSFKVNIDKISFLKGDILYKSQNNLRGTYTIKNDTTITFIDSLNKGEEYIYSIKDDFLTLHYSIKRPNDSTVAFIPPDTGIPWGRILLKTGGIFKKKE